jgi:protein phosphatase
VTRVLQGKSVETSRARRELAVGDRYLLCTDGLSTVVKVAAIKETLLEYSEPRACADRLVDLALEAGGPDNITVVVADVVSEEPA